MSRGQIRSQGEAVTTPVLTLRLTRALVWAGPLLDTLRDSPPSGSLWPPFPAEDLF